MPKQRRKPLAHFARRLVGEGYRREAIGRDAHHARDVGDAVRDDARLAAARPRDYEQRPVYCGYRRALIGVQPVQDAMFRLPDMSPARGSDGGWCVFG